MALVGAGVEVRRMTHGSVAAAALLLHEEGAYGKILRNMP